MRRKFILISALLSMILLMELSCTSYSQDNPHNQDNRHNFKIVYLDKTEDSIIITIMGRRLLMVHDPISLLKNKYYVDSVKVVIPQNKAFIKSSEIRVVGADYQIVKGGIKMMKDSLNINIVFYDYDEHKNYSWSYNGTYAIFWRH